MSAPPATAAMATSESATVAPTADVVSKSKIIPELTEFPLLDLLPELRLKIYEILVTIGTPIFARELIRVNRTQKAKGLGGFHPLAGRGDITTGQPNITKVSRQVRKDSLALYYSRNIFYMDGNVTEQSCMVPFTRYPSLDSTEHLRSLRQIGCLVSILDCCPNPASQHPQRRYQMNIDLSTTKNKNDILLAFNRPEDSTEQRGKYLIKCIKKAVGKPDNGTYDGHYLLKASIFCFEGLVCRDRKPAWRDLDLPPPSSVPLFGTGNATTAANVGAVPPGTAVNDALSQALLSLITGAPPPPMPGMNSSAQTHPNTQGQAAPLNTTAAHPATTQAPPYQPPTMPPAPTLQPITGANPPANSAHPYGYFGGSLTFSMDPAGLLYGGYYSGPPPPPPATAAHPNGAPAPITGQPNNPPPPSASGQSHTTATAPAPGKVPPTVTAGGGFAGWSYPHNPGPMPAPNAANPFNDFGFDDDSEAGDDDELPELESFDGVE